VPRKLIAAETRLADLLGGRPALRPVQIREVARRAARPG
jgi:hypothetical protein